MLFIGYYSSVAYKAVSTTIPKDFLVLYFLLNPKVEVPSLVAYQIALCEVYLVT